jgi:hypothetical protein
MDLCAFEYPMYQARVYVKCLRVSASQDALTPWTVRSIGLPYHESSY